MTPEQLLDLENFLALAVKLGITSFKTIKGLLADAGNDEAVIDATHAKLVSLRDSVSKAAGNPL